MKRPLNHMEMSTSKKPNLVESKDIVNDLQLNTANYKKPTPEDLQALTKELQNADLFVQANACNKLQVVAKQMQALAAEAKEIMNQARINNELNQVSCNFVKQPGHIYHLYKRPSGELYFGMLSPEEWGNCPHEYVNSYRYEFDRSFTLASQISYNDELLKMIRSYTMDKMLM